MFDFINFFLNNENLLKLLFSFFLFGSFIFFFFAFAFQLISFESKPSHLVSISAFFLVLCLILGAFYIYHYCFI